tara:strand:- start:862 stop:1185 length:324 start_codon:yes stop_codon:yes gene_type:complete
MKPIINRQPITNKDGITDEEFYYMLCRRMKKMTSIKQNKLELHDMSQGWTVDITSVHDISLYNIKRIHDNQASHKAWLKDMIDRDEIQIISYHHPASDEYYRGGNNG